MISETNPVSGQLRTRLWMAISSLLFLLIFSSPDIYAQAAPAPPTHISGVVVNRVTREPIIRALVFSPDNRFATMTDTQGRFEFKIAVAPSAPNVNPLQNVPYALTVKKPGFLQTSDSTVSLGAENNTHDITISLEPEAIIVGRVSLPSGEPPERIQVEIFRRQVRDGRFHWYQSGSVATRSSGEFRFAELAAGDYKIVTRELLDRDPLDFDPHATLYGYPPVYFPNATDFASAKTITVSAGMTMQADIMLTKRPYYPVKIAVANAPVGVGLGVTVSVQGRRGPGFALSYNVRTQTIEGMLPDGVYVVEAYNFAQNSSNGATTLGVRGGPVNGQITLLPDSAIAVNVKEEFSLDKTHHDVAVTFRGISGNANLRGPRSYMNVFLEPADDFAPMRETTLRPPTNPDDDSLVIEGVPPGRYWVRINSSRGFASSVTSGAIDLQHQPLDVGLGGTTSPIEITMRDESAELDGTVEGAAPPSAVGNADTMPHIYLVPLPDSSGEFQQVAVPLGSKFQLQGLQPGAYRVLAFDPPQPELAYRDPDAMRAYDSMGIVLHLTPGQKEQLHLHATSANP